MLAPFDSPANVALLIAVLMGLSLGMYLVYRRQGMSTRWAVGLGCTVVAIVTLVTFLLQQLRP